jgi:asparagine synthase (glutamine-hydrolysing)
MCGICGQYNFNDPAPVDRSHLQTMARTMHHRGPDDEGYYLDGPLGLGFRRLSIIDLDGGHQPMSDGEGTTWVVFNGEIYNFPELRSELEARGHAFRTRCDTEVIVHGYKEWGDDVFNHLNGMFGVAVWDRLRRRLVLARDPFGIKPLYYRVDHGRLYFGSEIRAINAASSAPPAIDPVALNLFLRHRFTPSPYTLYQGVHKLGPGSMLIAENGHCTTRLWYQFAPEPFSRPPSPDEACEELLALYTRSVKRHLLSDVPVGLLLSGGIDSALLLALMNLHGASWRTYTVGYGSSFSDDELVDAARTADALSSQHTPVLLDHSTFEAALPGIISSMEEPVATSSIVPMYFVCARARQDVKVVLVGQGPDELFGGYRRHLGVRYAHYWTKIPIPVRAPLRELVCRAPRNEGLKRAVRSLDTSSRFERYQNVLSLLPGSTVDGLFHPDLVPEDAGNGILRAWQEFTPLMSRTDELGGLQFLEVRSTLPDELLMYSDKLSMAHSLEARVPYLDKEIVEFAERLPAGYKVRNGSRKWLHRMVCRHYLPSEVIRRKKRGFACNVVDQWFKEIQTSDMNDALADDKSHLYAFLRPASVRQLLREHQSGAEDNHKILFSLVVVEHWLRLHNGSL